jgi:hypothetical protein
MTKTMYEVFERLRKHSRFSLSSDSLVAARDYFYGYLAALEDNAIAPSEGVPPFRQFTDWVARRFGKSGKSLRGPSYRYHGGFWRLISEKYPESAEAHRHFFSLLDEFQSLRPEVVCEAHIIPSQLQVSLHPRAVVGLRALRYAPEQGFYLCALDEDVHTIDLGFFSNFDAVCKFSATTFQIAPSQWVFVTAQAAGGEQTKTDYEEKTDRNH